MVDFFQFLVDPFCAEIAQYHFIILIIGLTFVAQALGILRAVLDSPLYIILNEPLCCKRFPIITYKTIFDFAFISAFSLIIVDLFKIILNLTIVFEIWNIDAIIKFFLCLNIAISTSIVYFVTRRAIKEKIAEPLYPPEEIINSTIGAHDQRAIA